MLPSDASNDGNSIGNEIVIDGRPSDGRLGKSGSDNEMLPRDASNDGNSIGNEIVIEGRPSDGKEGRSGSEKEGKLHITAYNETRISSRV